MPALAFVRAFNNYLKYRRNLLQLSDLDDRMLRDIGMNRTELMGRAWEQIWR